MGCSSKHNTYQSVSVSRRGVKKDFDCNPVIRVTRVGSPPSSVLGGGTKNSSYQENWFLVTCRNTTTGSRSLFTFVISHLDKNGRRCSIYRLSGKMGDQITKG